MTFLLRYWPHIFVTAAALFLLGWAGRTIYVWGGQSAVIACQAEKLALFKADQKALAAERARADQAEDRLAKVLAMPRAEPRIVEVVRANPSGCSIPQPVGDRLRREIERANAEVASSP